MSLGFLYKVIMYQYSRRTTKYSSPAPSVQSLLLPACDKCRQMGVSKEARVESADSSDKVANVATNVYRIL